MPSPILGIKLETLPADQLPSNRIPQQQLVIGLIAPIEIGIQAVEGGIEPESHGPVLPEPLKNVIETARWQQEGPAIRALLKQTALKLIRIKQQHRLQAR